MWLHIKTLNGHLLWTGTSFLNRFRNVTLLFTLSFMCSTLSPPCWKSNKSADIDPAFSAGLILFQSERGNYLEVSWQTIVFTVFLCGPIKQEQLLHQIIWKTIKWFQFITLCWIMIQLRADSSWWMGAHIKHIQTEEWLEMNSTQIQTHDKAQ